MKKAGAFLSLIVLAVSCNHVYKEYDRNSFPTYVWEDGQEISFSPEVKEVGQLYQLTLGLQHHYNLGLEVVKVSVKIVSPSGEEYVKNYEIKIKDEENKNLGSCAGDRCDLETMLEVDLKFEETGIYQVLVKHEEHGYSVPGIMGVGLILDELKD